MTPIYSVQLTVDEKTGLTSLFASPPTFESVWSVIQQELHDAVERYRADAGIATSETVSEEEKQLARQSADALLPLVKYLTTCALCFISFGDIPDAAGGVIGDVFTAVHRTDEKVAIRIKIVALND